MVRRDGNIADQNVGRFIGRRDGNYSFAASSLGIDVDAQIYIDAMTTPPDGARRTVINQFFLNTKGIGNFGTDDIFSQLDEFWILAAADSQAALLGGKRLQDATEVNAPTFTVDRGYVGAATEYLNSNFIQTVDGVNYRLNDASFGSYERTDVAEATTGIGVRGVVSGRRSRVVPRSVAGDFDARINQNGTTSALVAVANSLGLNVARRSASNAFQAYKNGVEIATQVTLTDALSSRAFFILAFNVNGVASSFSSRQTSFAFVAAGLSPTEHLNLFNSVEAYMDSVGAGVVA